VYLPDCCAAGHDPISGDTCADLEIEEGVDGIEKSGAGKRAYYATIGGLVALCASFLLQ